jgi:glucose/arabinose dehydrogenase
MRTGLRFGLCIDLCRKLRICVVTVVIGLAVSICNPAHARPVYPDAGSCDGLPRIDVTTPSGFCVALVAQNLTYPRGVLPLKNGNLLVADLGGWVEKRGTVWLLKKTAAGYEKHKLLEKLDRPNAIVLGPDGLVYIGLVGRIARFDLRDPKATLTDVVGGQSGVSALPGSGRHPLTAMVFDRHGDLFVNVGSATDHCEQAAAAALTPTAPNPDQICPETQGKNPRGVIRKYTMQWPAGTVKSWRNYAFGLRNSMALAFQPDSDILWQAENSRDAIQRAMPQLANDEDLPHDELNRIVPGANYGWPTCFDQQRASPEYPHADCTRTEAPVRLLPAHAAPLGMVFYQGLQFPAAFRHSLIIGFHGYRRHGHRIVALMADDEGTPSGKMVNLVSGWNARGDQPMGAPVDVKVGADGALYLAEDRNGTILSVRYVGNVATTVATTAGITRNK